MRAVGLMRHGGPEVLEVVDLPEVHAGSGQVRLRVQAAAVNPTDTMARNGSRAEQQKVDPPPYVRQLMSRQALLKTGYFDPAAVLRDYDLVASGQGDKVNVFLKMGLTGVLSTQLWHHLYAGGGLCELPEQAPMPAVERPSLPPAAA